jgi:hypothetical protein
MRLALPAWTPLLLVALGLVAWPVAGIASGGPSPEWVHSDEGDPVPAGDPVNAAADATAAELAEAGVTSVGLETAPWRGTERATDNPASTSSGSKIKLVYVYAADQPDRFGQYASLIQTDAKAIAETVAARRRCASTPAPTPAQATSTSPPCACRRRSPTTSRSARRPAPPP